MRVLGIDPGYDRCGIAIIERNNAKEALLHADCICTDKNAPFIERLAQVITETKKVIAVHAPTTLAIETLLFNKNQKTAMRVAEVRGALLYLAHEHGLATHEYSPQQIKAAVAGNGGGSKADVMRMVELLLRLPKKKRLDDEYDAIAAALTHSAIHR